MATPSQYTSQSTGLYTPLNLGNRLGNGAFGTVYHLHDNTGAQTPFICKQVTAQLHAGFEMSKRDCLRKIINEISALKTMRLLEGYARDGDTFYIIMKKVPGNTTDIRNDDAAQACFNALRDCHRNNITHFDSHAGNFIQDLSTKKATAIDFGFARDASFFNVFLDSAIFIIGNNLIRNFTHLVSVPLKLFARDYVNYVKHSPLEALSNLAWWGMVVYGALYSIPALIIPQHFFYDYLKTKLLHQVFLELRGIGLVKQHFAEFFLQTTTHIISAYFLGFRQVAEWGNYLSRHHESTMQFLIKYAFKPVYLIASYIPYIQLKNFYNTHSKFLNTVMSFFNKNSSAQQVVAATSASTCVQAALLYYPVKECLKFVDDAVVNPFQPQAISKARADMYFQYRPDLYLKAAGTTVCNATKSIVSPVLHCFRASRL